MALTDKLSAIGEAIREKTGKSDLLTLDAMPEQIRSIETGSSSGSSGLTLNQLANQSGVDYFDLYDDELETIDIQYAFAYRNIESINLPKLHTISNSYAFGYCQGLEKVNLPNLIYIASSSTFMFCSSNNFTEVALPKFQQAGAYNTFRHCYGLKYVQLPSCLNINNNFFANCSVLTAVVLAGADMVELTSTTAFSSTPFATSGNTEIGIYVPDNLVDTYKSATNWVTYAEYIKPISSYPGESAGYPALVPVPQEV